MSVLIPDPTRLMTLICGGHHPIVQLAVSPDERTLLCVQHRDPKLDLDWSSILHFFDLRTGDTIGTPTSYEALIASVRWSKDGTHLYLADKNGNIWCSPHDHEMRIADAQTLYRTVTTNGPSPFTVLSNGLIAFVTRSGLVRVLERQDETHKTVMEWRRKQTFEGIIAHPHLPQFLSTDNNETFLFENTPPSGEERDWRSCRPLPHLRRIIRAAWTPNGTQIFSHRDVIVIDTSPDERHRIDLDCEIHSILMVDDETILVSTKEPNCVIAIRIPNGEILWDMDGFAIPVADMCLFGNGRYLVTSISNRIPFEDYRNGLRPIQIYDFGSENLGRKPKFLIPDIDA